jgi:hypothetical protein
MVPNLWLFLASLVVSACGNIPKLANNDATNTLLFPLAPGRSWTYSLTVNHWALCNGSTIVQQVLGTSIVEGRVAFELSPMCSSTYTDQYSVVVDRIDIRHNNRWVPALDSPAEAGHQWDSGDVSYEWDSIANITVKAGTFQNCWKRKEINDANDAYEIYCTGVGKVVGHFADNQGNGWDAELTGKSF